MTDDVAVLDALRTAVLDGEFAAGQRLVEVDLSERFGCSRFAVPGRGLRVPMLASGQAAAAARDLLGRYGGAVEVLDGPAGAAATRKLLRSVFYKGMAAAVLEALLAARAAGCEDWLRAHIAEELTAADVGTLDRLEQGSYQHATRRAHEMAAASDLLGELAIPPRVARASQLWLEELAGQMRLTDGTVRIRDD